MIQQCCESKTDVWLIFVKKKKKALISVGGPFLTLHFKFKLSSFVVTSLFLTTFGYFWSLCCDGALFLSPAQKRRSSVYQTDGVFAQLSHNDVLRLFVSTGMNPVFRVLTRCQNNLLITSGFIVGIRVAKAISHELDTAFLVKTKRLFWYQYIYSNLARFFMQKKQNTITVSHFFHFTKRNAIRF